MGVRGASVPCLMMADRLYSSSNGREILKFLSHKRAYLLFVPFFLSRNTFHLTCDTESSTDRAFVIFCQEK